MFECLDMYFCSCKFFPLLNLKYDETGCSFTCQNKLILIVT